MSTILRPQIQKSTWPHWISCHLLPARSFANGLLWRLLIMPCIEGHPFQSALDKLDSSLPCSIWTRRNMEPEQPLQWTADRAHSSWRSSAKTATTIHTRYWGWTPTKWIGNRTRALQGIHVWLGRCTKRSASISPRCFLSLQQHQRVITIW